MRQKLFTKLSKQLTLTDTKHGHNFVRFAIKDEEDPKGDQERTRARRFQWPIWSRPATGQRRFATVLDAPDLQDAAGQGRG